MKEETIEGNKLIAESMQGEVQVNMSCKNYTKMSIPEWAFSLYNFDVLKVGGYEYNSSWDWQIPVWSKVAKQVKELLPKLSNPEPKIKNYFRMATQYEKAVFNNDPKSGQEIIVEMIKWYNQNKPK